MAGFGEFGFEFFEDFVGGFCGGCVGVGGLDFLNGAVEGFPFFEFGVAVHGGGEAAGFVVVGVGVEDDEGEVGEEGVVVVAEGEVGVAEGEEEFGEEFFVVFGEEDSAEVFDGFEGFAIFGVCDSGANLGVGGGGCVGGAGEDVVVEAYGFAPAALEVEELGFEEDGFVGGDAGDVAEGFGLEDEFVEGGLSFGDGGVGGLVMVRIFSTLVKRAGVGMRISTMSAMARPTWGARVPSEVLRSIQRMSFSRRWMEASKVACLVRMGQGPSWAAAGWVRVVRVVRRAAAAMAPFFHGVEKFFPQCGKF